MNIERMRKAVAFWRTIPDTQWNMDLYYFSPNQCGCALGQLATHHHEGWCMFGSVPKCASVQSDISQCGTAFKTAEDYFGLDSIDSQIFCRVGRSPKEAAGLPTHKQIFFMRLDKMLADKGIPMSAIYGPDLREESQNGPDDADSRGNHPMVKSYEYVA